MFSFYPVSSAPFSSNATTGAAYLSGVYAQALTGTVTDSDVRAVTGVYADAVLGIASPGISITLMGVSAQGFNQQIGPIFGVVANGFVGSVSINPSVQITGVSANGYTGNPGYWYWDEINDDQTSTWTPITTV